MSNSVTSGITLAPLSVDIVANTEPFVTGMRSASATGVQEAENLSKQLTKVSKVGDSISGLGSKLTMGLTLPLAAAGVAAVKVGMDYESQMSRVKAISGATGAEFEKLDKQAIALGASTAFSATEAAEGMENLASAGFSTNEIMQAMPGMMDLAASSGEDLASSADIAASTLRGFGLEASQAAHVADVLAKNSADTNAAVADTGEAMKYVAPVAHSMGLSLEEVTASIGIMANAGIKGSEAGTTLRTALSRLADPSSEAAAAMKTLSYNAFDAQGNLLPLKDVIGNLKSSTKNLTMEQKQQAISTIFGTEAMSGMLTLVDAGPEQLEALTTSLKNSDGAAKNMATTMQDNAKSSIEQMKGSIETAAIKLEKSLAPTIIKITDKVGELADKFSNLSEEQQMNILKWAAIAMAAGPVLKIFGSGISTVAKLGKGVISLSKGLGLLGTATSGVASAGSLAAGTGGMGGLAATLGTFAAIAIPVAATMAVVAGGLYYAYENNEYLNTSLATTTEELSPLQRGINELNGGVIKSKEEMEKLGLIYHDWSSNVSPEVVSSIDDTAKAWQDLNFQVDYLKANDLVISQSTVDNLKSQTDKICNGIIEEIKTNQSSSTKELSEFFNVDGALDTYESNVLSFFDSNGQKQMATVQEYQTRINTIYQTAADEHRKIAESEYIAIEEYEKKINQVKIDSLSKTSAEYQELQASFNVKMRSLDLQGASELMQEKAGKRDEDIASTSEYYDTKIELLSMNLGNMNEQQRIAAQIEIDNLQKEKDKKLGVINSTYNEYLKTIETKYPEIYARIDHEEGKILGVKEQAERQGVIDSIANMDNIASVTESGMQRLYNSQSKTYEDVYVKVDENTGKIVGCWNKTKDEIWGNNEDIRNELGKTSSEYNNLTESQKRDMLSIISSNENYSASAQSTATQVINALQGTGTNVNGLYTEVINLNGTPVTVQVNKDGTISNLDEIISKANQIPSEKYITVYTTYTDENGKEFSASMYTSNGRGGYYYNYNGIESVPYDGYTSRLHKGERVLTAEESKEYSKVTTNNNGLSLNIENFVNNRKQDVKALAQELAFYGEQVARGGGK